MFDGLISGNLARVIAESVSLDSLTEIRLRVGRRLLLLTTSRVSPRVYPVQGGGAYIVTREDVDGVLARATNMSPYSVSDEMICGYIPSKCVRIGVGGEGVTDGGKPIGLRSVSYLVIRVPHQVKSAADGVIDDVYRFDGLKRVVKNTLVISPPGAGKTTLLRELARRISYDENVVLIDERYELAAVCDGAPTLDVGDADVVSGLPKSLAYENCVRALNPSVIVTDELFRAADVLAICDVIRSGVKVVASVHGDGVSSLLASSEYSGLLKKFELAVVLGENPVGSVREKVWLCPESLG